MNARMHAEQSSFDAVPSCLRERPQWVMWRRIQRSGEKATKVPFMPNGASASHSNPATWSAFDTCLAAMAAGRFDGIGFVFSSADPFCGIDLDGCFQSDGTLKAWAIDLVAAAQEAEAYVERTPSGLGLHIIGHGIVGPGRKRAFDGGAIELYDRDRYFTVSGEQISLGDAAAAVGAVLALARRQFGLTDEAEQPPVAAGAEVPDYEADKLTAAVLANASSEFLSFWNDKIEVGAHGGDRSGHRLSLLNRLALKLWGALGREPNLAELRAVALRSRFIRNEMHVSRGKWPRLAAVECGKAIGWARENRIDDGVETPATAAAPLSATPFEWVDPAGIPPRRWLFGQHYIRRFLTATVAPGGVGKSSLILVEAVAMALGRDLFDDGKPLPCGPLRVWIYALEDPLEEIQRRLVAILMHYGIAPHELGGRLFVSSGRDQPLVVAAERRGAFVAMPKVEEELIAELQQRRIDVLLLDPYVSTHRVSENDNTLQDAIAQIWKRVGDAADCSIELIHHTRKGNGQTEVSADDMRGAVAVRDACRAVRVISPMSEAEAQKLSVEVERRRFHFYAQDVKSNLTPPADMRRWFHLVSVDLGNSDGVYPSDKVGVVEPWQLPDALAEVTAQHVATMTIALRAMSDADRLKQAAFNVSAAGWFGHRVGEIVDIDTSSEDGRAVVKRMLNAWMKAEVLEKCEVRDAKKGRSKPCFRPGKLA